MKKRITIKKAVKALELPVSVVNNQARIEITGNSELVIDGCKGILLYDDDGIKINTGKNSVLITGHNLLVASYIDETMIITGQIHNVGFNM